MLRADRDALTVAMAVVPGLLSRNKHFGLYADADVRRARARAEGLRGVVRQLSHAGAGVTELVFERGQARVELRYRIPGVRLERRLDLSRAEAACLAYLGARAGVPGLHASEHDRAEIDAALRRLAGDAYRWPLPPLPDTW